MKREFLGGKRSKLRLLLILASFALLVYYVFDSEQYTMLIAVVLAALVFGKYLFDTYSQKDDEQ